MNTAVPYYETIVEKLLEVPKNSNVPKGKAESLLLMEESASEYRVIVIYDGPRNGAPKELLIPRK